MDWLNGKKNTFRLYQYWKSAKIATKMFDGLLIKKWVNENENMFPYIVPEICQIFI